MAKQKQLYIMTQEELDKIDALITSGEKVHGWCCVCGMPITGGEWTLIAKTKYDDTYQRGFRVDMLKRHTSCQRN